MSEELLYTAPFGVPPRRGGQGTRGVRSAFLAGVVVVLLVLVMATLVLLFGPGEAAANASPAAEPTALSLITATPDEGFALALRLASSLPG